MYQYFKSGLIGLSLLATSCFVTANDQKVELEFNVFGDLQYLDDQRFYEKNPNISIAGMHSDWGTHHNWLFRHIQLGDEFGDLLVVDSGMLGRVLHRVDAIDLSQLNIEGLSDIPEEVLIKGKVLKNELHSIPLSLGVSTLFYRDDVISQKNTTIETVISDWDNFINFGRQLKNDGVYLITNTSSLLPVIIESNLGSSKFLYFDNQLKIDVNNERIVKAFEIANQIFEEGLSAETGLWNDDWYDAFRAPDATVFSEINGEWLNTHVKGWMAPNNSGVWKLSVLPENNAGIFGGHDLIIPSTTELLADVTSFLEYVFEPESILERFEMYSIFPANTSVYTDDIFHQEDEYFSNQKIYEVVIENAQNLSSFQPTPYDYFIRNKLDLAFEKVKNDEMSIEQALLEVEALTKEYIKNTQSQAGE